MRVVLVDTSVWIDHLRTGEAKLEELLQRSRVLIHPFVIGELACGNLRNRATVLTLLRDLPDASVATNEEVLFFIDQHGLMGRGIGYVDAHLLASVSLAGIAPLWTRDNRLHDVALGLGFAYQGA